MKSSPLKLIIALVLLAGLATGAYFAFRPGNTTSPTAEKQLYTCSMHPEIIRDKPGDCPICGMKLTPIVKSAGAASLTITVDPATVQKMGLRTALVTKGPLYRSIRTVGVIDFDETSLADVTTKLKGWVEKLYVDSTGAQVHKGDPLFEFYSPELYSAENEYLLVLSSLSNSTSASAQALKAEALTKLKYYDVSDAQIAELEKTREAKKTLRINAPRDGIVVEKTVVEGQMVDAGMKLYRLADLVVVWLQAQIYEQDLPFVQLGQEATVSLSYMPDRKFRGRVTYIYPTVDDKTRTARVRMEFHNPGYYLKPGMFATVELDAKLQDDAVLIPDSAVLRSGEKNTVFIATEGGHFEPRAIELGPRGEGDVYQVLNGLKEGARVVTSGQFMLDSESQLREAIQKMQEPDSGEGAETNVPPSTPASSTATPPAPKIAGYVCPMPEHAGILYEHPGDCPICGMKLVPVTAETLAKIRPGGEVDYYICPMTDACPTPEHGAIHYDKPGKCPVCGMTLIPIMKTTATTSTAPTNSVETNQVH